MCLLLLLLLSSPVSQNTEYEVDFINNIEKLTAVGAKFDTAAYLTPEQTLALKF